MATVPVDGVPSKSNSSRLIAVVATFAVALLALIAGAGNASAADHGWTTSGAVQNVDLQIHNGLIAPTSSDADQFDITVINYNTVAVSGKISLFAVNKKGKTTGKAVASGGFQAPTDGPTTAVLLPTDQLIKQIKAKGFKSLKVRAKIALWTGGFAALGKAEGNYTIVKKLKGAKNAANTLPTAANLAYTVKEGATLSVPVFGLLSGATDADFDHLYLRVTQRPAHAKTFTIGADGLFTYVGAANFSGTDSFVFDIFDGTGYSAPVTVTLTVTPKAPTIATIADQKVSGGDQAAAQTVATKSFVSSSIPVTYALTGTPPAGATIDPSTGVITIPSGTVTAGSYSVTLSAQNSAGTTTKGFKIIVKPGKVGSIATQNWSNGVAISAVNAATAFTAASGATYSAGSTLPTGVTIDTNTGSISGTPSGAATGTATITVTDANGTATQTFSWTVAP